MSLDINGEKCAICKAYLFEDDDIAYCPECGAPHHRECFNSLGHCGLEEFHGTDKQYQKAEKSNEQYTNTSATIKYTCRMCGTQYDINEPACPNCAAPNLTKHGFKFTAFDFLGGVPGDTDLGEGVTADEAKKFVFTNTHRYIPKFLKFKSGSKASWNWMALLTPGGWLMSRKMYLLGAIVITIQIALTFLSIPFNEAISQLELSGAITYMESLKIIADNVAIIGKTPIILALISALLGICLNIIIAVFGDYFYKKHVISSIVSIKKSNIDVDEAFAKKGRVSLLGAVLGYFAVEFFSLFIVSIMGSLV